MPPSIRPAVPHDAARLAAFGAALFRQAYGPTHPEPTLGRYLAQSFDASLVARKVADPGTAFLVAEDDAGHWAGYAELHAGAPEVEGSVLAAPLPGVRPLEIVRFYVERAWHGRGVAHALMDACVEAARAGGADVLWLQAWQEAAQALRFYHKAGFTTVGTAVFRFGERLDADFLLARPVQASLSATRSRHSRR